MKALVKPVRRKTTSCVALYDRSLRSGFARGLSEPELKLLFRALFSPFCFTLSLVGERRPSVVQGLRGVGRLRVLKGTPDHRVR